MSAKLPGHALPVLIVVALALQASACKRRDSTGAGAAGQENAGGGACLETNPPAAQAAACQACLQKNALGPPLDDGCCGIRDPIGLQLCQAVSACMRAGGPPVGLCNLAGDTTTCFCGTHQADCDVPGKANGPCLALIAAAAGRNVETLATDKPDAATIIHRYGETKFALGRASNISAIAGAFCKAECGIGP
jgi:hypothetical protein